MQTSPHRDQRAAPTPTPTPTPARDGGALGFPPIFLLPTRLTPDELHDLEDRIPTLTYDANEAEIVLGNITKRERAMFELRRVKLDTEPLEVAPATGPAAATAAHHRQDAPSAKRSKSSASEAADVVKVLKLSWLTDSLDRRTVLPIHDYLIYEGRRIVADKGHGPRREASPSSTPGTGVVQRAAADRPKRHTPTAGAPAPAGGHGNKSQPPPLLQQTTSEHDEPLPPVPDFLGTNYSCQRPTPVDPPNGAFVEGLKKMRTTRQLQGDEIGVRAYSTSIATLAAYPQTLRGPSDVARLPGCGAKIAVLYRQWLETGQVKEASDATEDARMAVLRLFYKIWGVGDTTAREFYRKGWRDLDDLVEHGWSSLSRVQQIGVKYYDEFQVKISRDEVEAIGSAILEHARKIDDGFEMVIVGGYRRGKRGSGDVDVVVSHRDEKMTLNLVDKVVMRLERAGYISHTLSLTTRSSERGQQPLAWKGEGRKGSGFDTLDKALVVWRGGGGDGGDGGEGSEGEGPEAGAPHRRVDIIISPWKTAGCAVMGWSGGTTFQRDLRRYCKKERGLKFDSSGIRSRADGTWVDVESGAAGEPAPDMETAERRVFAGLGLAWRPPEERCTG